MARKRKRSRLKRFPLSLVLVVVVWVTSFLVWLFWKDIQKSEILSGKSTPAGQRQPSQEKISEEERKKLDEVLKQRR